MNQRISFWLMPIAEQRSFFQDKINQLASQYHAPVFAPHVTLYYGDFAIDTLSSLVQQSAPTERVRLQVDRLLYTKEFTKTLFVQFHRNPILDRISSSLMQGAIVPFSYEVNPHLSLIYHPLENAEKQRLASEMTLPFTEVWFDEIWTTSTSQTVQNREDVESWRVLHTFKLST